MSAEDAIALAARGFAVFPLWSCKDGRCTCKSGDKCAKPGKHPAIKASFSEATTDATAIRRWWTKNPSANIGVATGARSGVWVLDIDGPDGEETLRLLENEYGALPPTLTARTGNGRHLYFKYEAARPIKSDSDKGNKRNRPGIDVRGDGGYVVAPPSAHASGRSYAWINALAAAEPAPPWLIDVATNGVHGSAQAQPKGQQEEKKREKKPRGFHAEVNAAALANIRAWAQQLFPVGKFTREGGYRVPPDQLGHPDTEEGLSIHPKGIVDHGPEPHVGYTPIDLAMKFGRMDSAHDAAAWLAGLLGIRVPDFVRSGSGIISANSQRNVLTALAKLNITVAHDVFQDRLLIEGLDGYGPLLDDRAMERLWLTVDGRFGFLPSKDLFWTIVSDLARQNARHPVRDYLDALTWDGQPRIDTWLQAYGGAEDGDFVRAASAITLIAAVRRIRHPGCKFDEMLVLEGDQGTNKSTALTVLAVNDDWFTDDLPLNAEGKRVIEALAGRWIIEAAELKGQRKSDIEHLKAFLSRRVDRARMSYARLVTEVPRQCVIIGTTNSERYLRDSTGDRRYWPVRIRRFDVAALRRDRDQLWAEAAAREARGESIRLDPSLYSAAAAHQEERQVADPWVDAIEDKLGDLNGKILSADVWTLLGRPAGQRTQEDNARFGEAMRKLGWTKTGGRVDGSTPKKMYVRGTPEQRKRRIIVLWTEERLPQPYATDGGDERDDVEPDPELPM